LSARYGMEGGRVSDGGCDASSLWQVIAALRREEWFSNNVSHVVGDGRSTMFWTNAWVGGVSFRDRFSRLFDLAVFKEVYVFAMC